MMESLTDQLRNICGWLKNLQSALNWTNALLLILVVQSFRLTDKLF